MYTLLILIAAYGSASMGVTNQKITGYKTRGACIVAGRQAQDLDVFEDNHGLFHISFSCVKEP